jgi:hypothetical protein
MEIKANEGSAQNGEGQSKVENAQGVDELQKRIEQLEASNKRLLEESKGFKEKYKSSASEVQKKEEQIAMEKGDLQKLLEIERTRTAEVSAELNGMKHKVLSQELRSTVSRFAQDAIDLEDLMNQPAFAPILKDAVDPETLSVNPDKAKQFTDELRKAKPHLFKAASQPGVVTQKPGSQNQNFGPKTVSQMNSKEIEAAFLSGQFK